MFVVEPICIWMISKLAGLTLVCLCVSVYLCICVCACVCVCSCIGCASLHVSENVMLTNPFAPCLRHPFVHVDNS
jgi:hypothetical protein